MAKKHGKFALHEAMIIVLREKPNKADSTENIAKEIINSNLYKQKDGGDVFPDQIFLRARTYPKLFNILDKSTIKLK